MSILREMTSIPLRKEVEEVGLDGRERRRPRMEGRDPFSRGHGTVVAHFEGQRESERGSVRA